MRRTFIALWTMIVCAIAAIIVLGELWGQQREQNARSTIQELLAQQLRPYNRDIGKLFEGYQRQLDQTLAMLKPHTLDELVAVRSHPLVDQVVVVDDKGKIRYPTAPANKALDESLTSDILLLLRDNKFGRSEALQSQLMSNSYSTATDRSAGWTTWYHQRGLVLSYWMRYSNGSIAMVVVPRGRWLADLVAELPDTVSEGESDERSLAFTPSTSLIQLRDVESTTVYQWGNAALSEGAAADAEIEVSPPLEGWRLRMLLAPEARALLVPLNARWSSRIGVAGLSLLMLALGLLIHVNLKRQIKVAEQQVSFVNQVSHELRTPLTNIRMVTDLTIESLRKAASDDQELCAELSRLEVIQSEAARLGRLVENVLSFAKVGHGNAPLHRQVVDVHEVIDSVMRMFAPQLTELDIRVEINGARLDAVHLDRSVVEQILVNLIGNAIKYAASGHWLGITITEYSQASTQFVQIAVADAGPGIPRRLRRRVFHPFVRVSHRLEDPAGTGIGLTIARQLARRHGGDCTLAPKAVGCCFLVRLRTLSKV